MENLFLPYELAIKLKEKEFNEACFKFYNDFDNLDTCVNWDYPKNSFFSKNECNKKYCVAPLFSQVTNWFMEKHQIFIDIQTDCTSYPKFAFEVNQFYGNPKDLTEKEWGWNHPKPDNWFLYRTYNEALTEAIKFSLTLIK